MFKLQEYKGYYHQQQYYDPQFQLFKDLDEGNFENQMEKQHTDIIDADYMFMKSIENIENTKRQILNKCKKIDEFRAQFLKKLRNYDPDSHDFIDEELEKIYDQKEFQEQEKGKKKNLLIQNFNLLNEKISDNEELIIKPEIQEQILEKVHKKMNELQRITRRRERNEQNIQSPLTFTHPSSYTIDESQFSDLYFEKNQLENEHNQVLSNSSNNLIINYDQDY